MRRAKHILAVSGALLAFATASRAAVLETDFNFTTYGTQSGGATLTDQTGTTTGTLNTPYTSLTSSGLTVQSAYGNSDSTGVFLAPGSISGFTGDFTIQDWVTLSNPQNGVVLWGANNGPENTWCGDGYTGVSTLIGFTWSSLAGGGGAGNPLNQPYSRWGNWIQALSLNPGATYDMVLTYDASTYTFDQYINGSLVGSLQEAFSWDSLAGCLDFGIGGCPTEPWAPWGDASADETTSDFLLYNGALTASQVSALDSDGVSASLATISSVPGVTIVPEPVSLGLMGLGGLMLFRRRARVGGCGK
jgi:hypothetical protein